jgi:hypothetical protein
MEFEKRHCTAQAKVKRQEGNGKDGDAASPRKHLPSLSDLRAKLELERKTFSLSKRQLDS